MHISYSGYDKKKYLLMTVIAIKSPLHETIIINWTANSLASMYYRCVYVLTSQPSYLAFAIFTKILKVRSTSTAILDSERSEECIDFTMIITSRNNAPNSNYGGGFRCKSEYPWCIIEFSKKSRKTKKK
ncbi:Uncharacterized protein FWK35_00024847 [Aphis craccivora]|uniref:Uncharacterized protein n=1 Tax=Aphis craccivora TaxID=307492 RepID=A0A6G0YTK5_APHCR|nr:Uncharacterized protein FWK35_00024847 [Aphis craccivora]